MWWALLIIYLIGAILSWGMYISYIRKICPNGVFIYSYEKNAMFKTKSYDVALKRAIYSFYGVWYSIKYEQGFKSGFRWR